ncbi:alpha-L-fucosidase [Edaphobacter dinghuensis]|uniref:alpha-L-fucosidase n=1 Tax=Edaphobacter dinghuensis TaxID=1560005 RepID=A0A917M1K8_9BACT|nr:alpha-L-fucosidase [Edaphobacter dinghuensis]GGG71476.1 carbohydrate-binding protein [Edaphobacter dinghuensis]
MLNRREFTQGLAGTAALLAAQQSAIAAPAMQANTKPLLQLQQEFMDLRFGAFLHLNMATFEQREWGDPKASPKLFNPAHLDTDQWAQAVRSAGMAYGCLTTKHHDGFCLWPTKTTSPSVKDATFTQDVVASYANSFRKHGLKVCLYFSILDLRAQIWSYQVTPKKIALIKTQLSELLTNYGEITAIIIDGWNAGWSRITYDQVPFREIYDHIKSHQPNCLVADHNAGQYPGSALCYTDIKQYEQHAGQKIASDSIIPSESGTTLQSEWFWKESYPTEPLKSAETIVNDWLIPFNRQHCNLLINVAPNRDGRFDQNTVDRLAEVGHLWKDRAPAPKLAPSVSITTPNLAFARPSFASRNTEGIGPDLANDNSYRTYWIADDNETSGWIEIAFGQPTRFNTVSIVEPRFDKEYGTDSRIASYSVEAWQNNQWTPIASGKTPLAFQLERFQPVTAERVRLTIKGTTKPPGITEFGIYNEPVGL